MKKTEIEEISKEKKELYDKYIERIKNTCDVKRSCNHCYGRGIVGFSNDIPMVCSCIKRRDPKVITIGGESYTQKEYEEHQKKQKENENDKPGGDRVSGEPT